MVICNEPTQHTESRSLNSIDRSKPSWYRRLDNMFVQEMPGALGFFALANPLAAAVDAVYNVPAANGACTRLLVTAAGLAGMQPLIGKLRKNIYDRTNIYWMSERAKRVADTIYGAVVGSVLNPIFHEATRAAMHLPQSVPFSESSATGAVVGGLTGLMGYFASDAFSHTWSIENTPSRELKIPGASYIKNLPGKTKRAIALGATLLSFGATADSYLYRYAQEQAQEAYNQPHVTYVAPATR